MTRWLDEDESRAWRGLIEVFGAAQAALEQDLLDRFAITGADYGVLVSLSETEAGSMRMCDLAGRLHLSPSGLTRRLDGLVKRSLVARAPSDADRRVIMAVLTESGRQLLDEAAPIHVDGVRREVIDHLSRTQIRNIGAAFDALRRRRDEASGGSIPRHDVA